MTTHLIIASIAAIALVTSVSAKTASTIYNPQRVENVQRNIERYEWAKRQRDKVVANAEVYVALSADAVWNMVTPQSIPRGIEVNMEKGCPKCGKEIAKFGNYPWKTDVLGKPWKIECPSCGEIFPKNDFGRFYESGKDEDGIFRYEKADRSLLFNTDHPDPADPLHMYGVDDSMGYKDENGNVYRLVAYYGHYGSWTTTLAVLNVLQNAWLFTGDIKYARKAALLLYRVAMFYPDMDYNFWSKQGCYNSDGGTGRGKVYGCIWETSVADTISHVYDAIYPALDDPQLLAQLSKLAGKTVTATEFRSLCEKNLLHQIHDGIISGDIQGNQGMHQYSMASAAVVLDLPEVTDEWLDWLFLDGARGPTMTGGNMTSLFAEMVDDDGMGNEASPSYNSIWRVMFRKISQVLQVYGRYTRNSFVNQPKYKKMFEAPNRLIVIDKFVPLIGDTGKTGGPGLSGVSMPDTVYAYNTFKDPIFAQMAYFLNGHKADGLRVDIFDSDPEELGRQIQKEIDKHGEWTPKTDVMPSYGCAILRRGSKENARALSVYYGRNTGHGHRDTLNIELFGHGLDLMPDLGYPEFATNWPPRYESTDHTITHNTVVVDRKRQERNRLGKARFADDGDGVSAAEVYAGMPYKQCSLYQRTIAMVDIDEDDFYLVDIFRVKGGEEHMYSLHGPEGEIETSGLNLVDQPTGTLAGEDVELYADLGYGADGWANATGYQYFYNVRRDSKPTSEAAITYKVVDTWNCLKEPKDLRLRFNVLSAPGEIVLARTQPPRNKPGNPNNLWYLLSPNKAKESTYVSVIEPYVGKRTISKLERHDDGDTVTVTITTVSGRKDTVVSALTPVDVKPSKVTARFVVFSEEAGKVKTRLVEP